jgi:GTP-binding protein
MPCGGNGGRGGDVSVTAKSTVRSLGSIPPIINAGNGSNGKRDRANGSPGTDAEISVPIGVTVVDATTGRLLGDLDKDKQSIVVARGGNGGRGNNMSEPHESTRGEIGTSARIFLELKTIADIGLVGFPNAGKSTLLTMISKATPRIAPYPFTTLSPFIGTLDGGTRVADLPGLVEDAHLNRGMGHEFLRHIERTKALLFVIDSTCQHWNPRLIDSMGTIETVVNILRQEIFKYKDGQLKHKPWGVVINKVDIVSEETDGSIPSYDLRQVDDLQKILANIEDPYDVLFGCRGVVAASCKYGIGKQCVLDLIKVLIHDRFS